MTSPVTIARDRDGALLRLTLARPKANIIDAQMVAALDEALTEHADLPELKAVLLSAEGPHFSFGASVEEHLPDSCEEMIQAIDALILRLVEYPVPVLAAVRGQCLGGGLEIASAAQMMFAAPDARLGQPEIKLAVIAPAASCLLPEKMGMARACDLLFSGRSISAEEARSAGLVNRVVDDPEPAALNYFDSHLAPLSGASLRHATTAARLGFTQRMRDKLAQVEALYLGELMKTRDAVEGLTAFIEKRAANWENR